MRGRSCHAAGRMLDKRAAGLSAAERVRLESHLASCADCAADADDLDALTRLAGDPPELSPFARNRAINAALREPAPAAAGRPRRRWSMPVAGAAAVAAAAAVLMFVSATGHSERGVVNVSLPPPAPADRLVAGAIDIAGKPAQPGAAVPAETIVTATAASELVIAHARISVEAGSALLWRDQLGTVELREGVIHVNVDPRAERRFRVATNSFTVEVVGTEFTVTRDRVEVTRGRVLVLAADASVVAELGAGDAWSRPEEVAIRKRRTSRKSPATDNSAILAGARRALAEGDSASARSAITGLLASSASRSERAEARTLHAECALVDGKRDLAARRYLAVADRYGDLAAGENALFAAARLTANAGRTSDAHKLLDRYLERYPVGRFTKEARRRLDALD